MTDHTVIGKIGRVTGRIAPGTVGEVMIEVRGGVEAFYAYALNKGDVFEKDERVIVMEYEKPRTVFVSAYQ